VLELVMSRIKQERLEHSTTKQSLATLQAVLRAALQCLSEELRGGSAAPAMAERVAATMSAHAVDTSFVARELEELAKLCVKKK
jgi:hypothetical protein